VVAESIFNSGILATSSQGNGVQGNSSNLNGVQGNSFSSSASGVYGENMSGGFGTAGRANGGAPGVFGDNVGMGNGVEGHSTGSNGVRGVSTSISSGAAGVFGSALGQNANGVIGEANNGAAAYGVWGRSTSGFAGVFDGKVHVIGVLSKSAGGFRIDHCLDPENRYLSHSFVESPDMLNVYSGKVTTDENGDATAQLPDYFEELNRDFRYQLTVIGDFAQVMVAEEIRDNKFPIKTDRPNITVSWQVTGVRADAFARMNPIVVEEDKPAAERGTFLHPEAFGRPETQGVAYAREQALRAAQP